MPEGRLQLLVRTREEVIFEGEVVAVTSRNQKGLFDVLPIHGNFISLVNEKLLLHKIDGSSQEIKVPDGVLRVIENRVEVYVGMKVLK